MRRNRPALGAGLALALSPAPAHSETEAAKPAVLISNNLSVVRLRQPFFGGPFEPRCLRFRITSARKVRLTVSTIGLGRSRLAGGGQGCPPLDGAAWADRLFVSLDGSFHARTLALRVDPALAQTAELAEGEIVAVDEAGNRASAALKAGPNPPSSLWTAFTWFLGLLAPILVGGIATEGFRRRQSWNSEKEALDSFRELRGTSIAVACEEIKIVLEAEHMERPGQMIYDILNKHGILESLPRSTRRKMTDYCRANQTSAIVQLMRKQFPMCEEDLTASGPRR
ncbi:MAG TPA: hypothetical protein VF535_12310 [Allosphingosinicella sp.]|jgi:hypothetical protein